MNMTSGLSLDSLVSSFSSFLIFYFTVPSSSRYSYSHLPHLRLVRGSEMIRKVEDEIMNEKSKRNSKNPIF